jgi:hypothetical protein
MTNIEERPGAASKELERIASDTIPIYDENGAIEPDFLADVTAAIEAGDKGLGGHAGRTPARSRSRMTAVSLAANLQCVGS